MARNSAPNATPSPIIPPHPDQTRRYKRWLSALLWGIDVLMLFLAFLFGYYAREILPFFSQPDEQPPLVQFVPVVILQLVMIIMLFYFNRLYHQRRTFSRLDQARSIIGVVTLGVLLTNGIQELVFRNTLFETSYPRSMLFYVWASSLLFVVVGREIHLSLTLFFRRRKLVSDNLLVVGTGSTARDILKTIEKSPDLGYHVVGVVNAPEHHQGKMLGVPVLGNYTSLPEIIEKHRVTQIIIAVPDAKREQMVELVTLSQRHDVDVKIYPDIFAYMAGDLNVDDISGTPLLTVRDIALRGWKLSLKRGLDIFGSLFGLIFLSPLMLVTAIIIKRTSDGPAFFVQERMGLDGRPFPMIKFRSMRPDAELLGDWTTENDPRVTKIGRFMRRTNWDEIPQLINVLLGQMSLVGPRPEQPQYVNQFRTQIPRYMERHREKAGMTGWAQVHGLRGDTSIPERTSYDLWYVENWSLWLDIKIIFRTVIQTIKRENRNAY